ncbi:NAD-binding protein, partial [Sphingomonas endophytica]|uniref:NAD-binding protein n=1 Tax=Sphingomonas endophytica TaxID=869719 RepID=UPI0019D324CD
FETVNALAEAVAVAKHNGVDPKLLLDTLSKGSADSFALRNHGMKAIVPGVFPERAFSTEYALKDLSYALELAADAGIAIRGAELIGTVLQEAIDKGNNYPSIPCRSRSTSTRRSSLHRHSGACEARARKPSGRTVRRSMDSGLDAGASPRDDEGVA